MPCAYKRMIKYPIFLLKDPFCSFFPKGMVLAEWIPRTDNHVYSENMPSTFFREEAQFWVGGNGGRDGVSINSLPKEPLDGA